MFLDSDFEPLASNQLHARSGQSKAMNISVFIRQIKTENQKVRYTQYPIIRNDLIRNDAEISVNFKKPAFKGLNLRNA